MMNDFYVYHYIRGKASSIADAGTPYYVGKGRADRVVKKHTGVPVPKDPTRILFIKTNLSEDQAFALEKELIQQYGRIDLGTGILRNRTNGGEGASGLVMSEEAKAKMSLAKMGNPSRMGKPHSDITKSKISTSKRGQSHSADTKLKMSLAHCSSSYKILTPTGEQFIVSNLKKFARDNGLDSGTISKVANMKLPQHKGFRVERI